MNELALFAGAGGIVWGTKDAGAAPFTTILLAVAVSISYFKSQ